MGRTPQAPVATRSGWTSSAKSPGYRPDFVRLVAFAGLYALQRHSGKLHDVPNLRFANIREWMLLACKHSQRRIARTAFFAARVSPPTVRVAEVPAAAATRTATLSAGNR